MSESEYMNQKQAMAYLGIHSVHAFKKLVDAGLPQFFIAGNSKRYSKTSIDTFMEQHKVVVSTHKGINRNENYSN
ncbi:MAG: DNA-binding protein [Lactobacillus delbrueckii]|nr:DNA-binding protein [Lactobacillus delbrueckii]